jgi:hypothetical protein
MRAAILGIVAENVDLLPTLMLTTIPHLKRCRPHEPIFGALLGELREGVQESPSPGYYAVYFADPDGLTFELVRQHA